MANEKRWMCVEDFKKNLCHYCNTYMSEEPCEPDECWVHDVIAQTDTVDAVEVVHGRWIHVPSSDMMTGKAYKCSECGKMRYGSYMPNYCQCCGAKMDGDGNA